MEHNIFGLLPHRRSSSAKCFIRFNNALVRPPHPRLRLRPPDDAGTCLFGRMCACLYQVAGSAMVLLYVLHWADPKLLFRSDVPREVHVHVRNGSHPKYHTDIANAFYYERTPSVLGKKWQNDKC
jgi:hypothetical protein